MATTEEEFIVVFNSMSGRINTAATATVASKDNTKPLLEEVKKVRSIVTDENFLKSKRSVLQEKITNMQVRFLNLLRDGFITSGKLSDKIKSDLSNLLRLVEKETATADGDVKHIEDGVRNVVSISATKDAHDSKPWYCLGSVVEKIRAFHVNYAAIPADNGARGSFEKIMESLRRYLNNNNLCDRVEYTGSVYEKVNICGDTLEFDMMFVKITKDLEAVSSCVRSGYAHLKPKDAVLTYSKFVDRNEVLDTEKYKTYFYGVIQKYLNEVKDIFCIKLRKHGVASQLDVFEDKEAKKVWFYVDLVPAFEIGDDFYVPKPPKNGKSIEWRKSYSRQEKDLFKKIDGVNECRKHCVRIIKALFKLCSNGLFKEFTSYCIKTVAFQLKDDKETDWTEKNIGGCIILFLKKIQKHLEEGKLCHTFEEKINLLEGIRCDQMSSTLKNKLKSQKNFLEWLDVPAKLKT